MKAIIIKIEKVKYDFYNFDHETVIANSEYGDLIIQIHQEVIEDLKSTLIDGFAYEVRNIIERNLNTEKVYLEVGLPPPDVTEDLNIDKIKELIVIENFDEVSIEIFELIKCRNIYLKEIDKAYHKLDNKLVTFFNNNKNLKYIKSKGYITNPDPEKGEQ